MNKDHILGLYDDLSHFCQTGKLKQADYSGYSRELEIIVKKFSSDCDRSKNDNVFIVEDCRITSNDSDYSNFLYMALITLGNYIPVYTSLSIIITNSHKLIGIEFVRNKERR